MQLTIVCMIKKFIQIYCKDNLNYSMNIFIVRSLARIHRKESEKIKYLKIETKHTNLNC